jgi:hypothetical protein
MFAPPVSAYAAQADGSFLSSQLTRGPWHPDHQHAGPPIALVCRCIERAGLEHGLTHLSRLTANLLRPVPVSVLSVQVEADYVGRNAGHFSARLLALGKEIGRFTALMQRETEVALPAPEHPAPERPLAPEQSPPAGFDIASNAGPTHHFTDGQPNYGKLVEMRTARGHCWQGPCAIWFRMNHPLLDSEPPSVYQRVAVAADSGNGISAILDFTRYTFLNSDLTINLLRRPRGEWVCLDARTLFGPSGSGLAESLLFDAHGVIGRATQSLVVREREAVKDRG